MSIAATDLRSLLVLAGQSDITAERKLQKYLLKSMDKIVRAPSDLLGRLSKGPPVSTPIVRWMEEEAYPTSITGELASTTLTITGTILSTSLASVTAAGTSAIKQVIRVGTILMRESDRVQAKVTDISGLTGAGTYTVTVEAYGNTSLSNDSAGVTWRIVQEAVSDYTPAGHFRSLDRKFRECYTQLFEENFAIPKTRLNTKYEMVPNEDEHQMKALLDKMRRSMSESIFNSRPYWSGSAYGGLTTTDESTMCGLMWWAEQMYAEHANANVYKNLSSTALAKEHIDDVVTYMRLQQHTDFNSGEWVIVCHPLVNKQINKFDESYRRTTTDSKKAGHNVNMLLTDEGKEFKIVIDSYISPDVLHVLNLSDVKYGYYANDEMDKKKIETDNRVFQWLLSFQVYGLVLRKPTQSLGTIYGIATS
jgi:hypothetical protein